MRRRTHIPRTAPRAPRSRWWSRTCEADAFWARVSHSDESTRTDVRCGFEQREAFPWRSPQSGLIPAVQHGCHDSTARDGTQGTPADRISIRSRSRRADRDQPSIAPRLIADRGIRAGSDLAAFAVEPGDEVVQDAIAGTRLRAQRLAQAGTTGAQVPGVGGRPYEASPRHRLRAHPCGDALVLPRSSQARDTARFERGLGAANSGRERGGSSRRTRTAAPGVHAPLAPTCPRVRQSSNPLHGRSAGARMLRGCSGQIHHAVG